MDGKALPPAPDNMDLNGEAYGQCLSRFVDQGSTESHRYYRSRRTLLEMLKDRGYAISSSDIDLSLDDFRSMYGQDPDPNRLRFFAYLRSDPCIKVLVIFFGPGPVKVNLIRSIVTQIINKDTLSRLILVVQNDVSSQAMKAVELFPFKVEIFQITDLLVNITKHALKPRHQLLTEEEKQKLLKKFNLEDKQLPRMLQKDAIARYYGLEKGQVVKVSYSGEITGSHVTYRCVW
ncbi:DNA-directed RNA polymerase V subunit 5A-like [Diospyros lotus]|uniref:DNA-directed RNA polymerase V subunit 5A-like n=1 Tax=Diospyros lotus TaxID=55363 RepID=UPI00224DE4D3|nr:DNA-directed RNA polymerase V subunit 5A-like [Diospyros lotus]